MENTIINSIGKELNKPKTKNKIIKNIINPLFHELLTKIYLSGFFMFLLLIIILILEINILVKLK